MKVTAQIPATIANLGCGFDGFGLGHFPFIML